MSELLRVLLVEDNPADVDFIRETLPEGGPVSFRIESMRRLSEALARLESGGIDLVLLDLGLPDSQGLETFRSLRKAAPHIPTIILTGNDDQATAIRAVREGAQDYLVKGQVGGGLLARAACYALERKRAEERERLAREVLELLNAPKDPPNTVGDILRLVKASTSFEAVGIRLREGDDYPYYEANGFSEDFLRDERYLCERDAAGEIVRDGQGRPVLECMCGNVIRGRTDPALAFFTGAGSFWTNSTTDLPAQTTEKERQARTRNRCNGEGYESVALIPLRSGSEIIGLLQLNDRRRGMLTPEMIRFFEGLGASIGIALARKRTEENIRQSEEQFRLIMGSLADLVAVLDLDGRRLYNSPSYRDILGDPGSFQGSSSFKQIHPEDRAQVQQAFRDTVRTGIGHRLEYRLMDRAGQARYIESQGSVIRDDQGKVAKVLVVSRDVTERKRAEEALRDSEARYRAFFEGSVDGILIADIETRVFKYANPALCRMLGYTEEELRTMGVGDIHPKESLQSVVAEFEAQTRGDKTLALNIPCLRKDGSILHADINTFSIALGRRTCNVGFFRDITDRKRAEEALRRKSAVDAALAELSAELLNPGEATEDFYPIVLRHARALTGSEHGFIASVDARTGDLIGNSLTEMMGKECRVAGPDARIAFPRGADGRYTGLWGHSLNTREPFFTNAPSAHPAAAGLPEGQVPLRNFLSVPVIVEDELLGQIALANAARDYASEDLATVRRLANLWGFFLRDQRAKNNLRQSEGQLRQAQKMDAVGRLAGGVAHDFNNMLQVILMGADMALAEATPGSPLADSLQEIKKAGQRSADLTRQLLAFARKQIIAPRVLDLNDTVAGILKMLGRLIGEDIDLLWKPGHDLKAVKMDPGQIDQILANLVVNARDAIAGVGKVTIETGKAEFDQAYCNTHPGFTPGQYVMLAVSDDGCGMDKETLANIFEPFFTTKGAGKGTGLGLATVYGIVKQNNGFINVYSEPGKGTTFKIYLPPHESEAAAGGEKRESGKAPTGTETVLLVEDEEALLTLAKRLLEHLGYTVLAAGSPQEAIRLVEEHAVDIHLLVTDIVMPEMSGGDLWQRLTALRPGLKCLFMSGYTANVIAHRAILEEGVHFLQKPFSVESLAAKAREALSE